MRSAVAPLKSSFHFIRRHNRKALACSKASARRLRAVQHLAGLVTTFDDMRAVIRQELEVEDGTKLRPSFERSLRQALHRMVGRGGGLIDVELETLTYVMAD